MISSQQIAAQLRSVTRLTDSMPFILGSETRNVSGDRHSHVPFDHHIFCGHLVTGMIGWIEHHASDSEAIVKAENQSIVQTIPELQASTVEHFMAMRL